jgi:hypothetical protein
LLVACEPSATARPSTPENKTRIAISIPASAHGQDLEITVTPKKARKATMPWTPIKPLLKLDLSPATVEEDAKPQNVQNLLILGITETPPKGLVEYGVPLDILL